MTDLLDPLENISYFSLESSKQVTCMELLQSGGILYAIRSLRIGKPHHFGQKRDSISYAKYAKSGKLLKQKSIPVANGQ